ncbi:MAG: hypothetical protein NC293_08615 [Roseburia sp.]|nr:hypothetical protein [Roseburia sp.]
MKLKWFLRGLGLGIVLTALLLCVTYRASQKNNNVIRQAKELGMVFPEAETNEAEQTAEQLASEVQNDAASGAAVSGEAVDVKTEEEKKAEAKINESKEDIRKASRYNKNTKSFVVRSGLLSSSVSREMEEAGIIEDSDEFDEYLEKKGYARQVRSGTYKIPVGADFETIAKIITRQD